MKTYKSNYMTEEEYNEYLNKTERILEEYTTEELRIYKKLNLKLFSLKELQERVDTGLIPDSWLYSQEEDIKDAMKILKGVN